MAHFPPGWIAVTDGESFEKELRRECSRKHRLHGTNVEAIARRLDRDDVLFRLVDEPPAVAQVHLTWSGKRERDPTWPTVALFDSVEAWQESLPREPASEFD